MTLLHRRTSVWEPGTHPVQTQQPVSQRLYHLCGHFFFNLINAFLSLLVRITTQDVVQNSPGRQVGRKKCQNFKVIWEYQIKTVTKQCPWWWGVELGSAFARLSFYLDTITFGHSHRVSSLDRDKAHWCPPHWLHSAASAQLLRTGRARCLTHRVRPAQSANATHPFTL